MSAAALAASIRSAERSARSVTEEHLEAINDREDQLHTFNLIMIDEALEAADAVDKKVSAGDDPGPLAGVPVAMPQKGAAMPQ